MKRITLLLCLSISSVLHAQLLTTHVKNFHASYEKPHGLASADSFRVGPLDFGQQASFEVLWQSSLLTLSSRGINLYIENPPEILSQLEQTTIENLNISSAGNQMTFAVDKITVDDKIKTFFYLREASLSCEGASFIYGQIQNFLDTCLNNNARAKVDYIRFDKDIFKGVNVTLKNNNLNFFIDDTVDIKGEGKGYYDQSTQQIRLRVDRVRMGFLNITNQFFKNISDLESEQIKINKPWITISI